MRRYIKYLSILLLFIIFKGLYAQSIAINEVMSKNASLLMDADGDFEDWIELYNYGSVDINLEDFWLSDDEDNPAKWTFPDVTIEAGGFLVVFASEKDEVIDGEVHTNFKVRADGEELVLSDDDGNIIDLMEKQGMSMDESWGRMEDGMGTFTTFHLPTPGNSNEYHDTDYAISFSHEAGQYFQPFELTIDAPEELTLHYTTDGSVPTADSPIYEDGILLASREGDPNTISTIPVTEEDLEYEPVGEVYKINTIRVRAFMDDWPMSKIHTRSFMIDPNLNRYTIPMISLVTEADHFFDDEQGIYVPGEEYDGSENSMNCFQRGKDWERPVHFEYFGNDGNLVLAQDAGIRTHGTGSRRNRQKSMRLYARADYGPSRFEHQFFENKEFDSFKRLILRAQPSSNRTYMTDEVMSRVLGDTDLPYMSSKEVVVFLNGEFWGIFNLRERMDKYFLQDTYGVDKDNITILQNNADDGDCCVVGEPDEYIEMLEYIEDNDITDAEVYAQVQEMMDVENYIEYLIIQFHAANYDWPNFNIRYWKENTAASKWRWLPFDFDFALRFEERPSITNFFQNETSNNEEWATYLAERLMENDTFYNRFFEKFENYLNTVVTQENMEDYVNQIRDKYEPQMQEYFDRYELDVSMSAWNNDVDEIYEEFGTFRACFLKEQLIEQFDEEITVFECDGIEPPTDDETPDDPTPDPEPQELLLDLGIIDIENPDENILEGYHILEVSLLNFGSVPINTATLYVSINGEDQPPYPYPGPVLEQGESSTVPIGTFEFEGDKEYEIRVRLFQPNGDPDVNPDNDEMSIMVNVEAKDCQAEAKNDYYISNGSLITMDVLENDDLEDFYLCGFSNPENGTVVQIEGRLQYMPFPDFIGTDELEYYVCNDEDCGPMEVVAKVEIDVNNPECLEGVKELCTPAYTPMVVCPEFCLFDGTHNVSIHYELTGARSFFTECTIAFIDEHCFRYTPLPGFEEYGLYDEISIYACNNDGLCDTAYIDMAVGECGDGRILRSADDFALLAYPNPSDGLFNLIIPETEDNLHLLRLYNVEGRLMKEETVTPEHIIPNHQIDLRGEAKGIYFLHWQNGDDSKVLKLLVR